VVTVLEGHKGKEYRGHSASVAKMVKEVSRTLGLKARETYCNVLAAYLHDCCMNSPHHLTLLDFNGEDKSEVLPKFAQFSDRLFERAKLPEEVRVILTHTFERYDGKGFPEGLKAEAVPPGARIIAVVDAFMHLMAFQGEGTVRNRYREAFNHLKGFSGTRFAPEAVDALEEVVIEEFVDDSSPRVIVVDSSSEERLFLVSKLKKCGIKAYMCRDTAEATDILQRERVSLVLAETETLPMDGFTFCSTVKRNENYRETSFLLISSDPDAISKGFEAGADDFIIKPYNPDILVAKIQNFIRLSAQKTAERAKRLTSRKGIAGNLSEIQIADLIQMLSAGRKTGVLKLVREGENGEMFFNNGEVINARYESLDGVDAFNLLIRWDRGHFVLDPDGKPPEQKIYENTAMLLLEACRLWDEEKGAEG
jgi:response regulator RpfG family c-di-GMP phosphodiesterase